ncbi:MAG: hypothetical protein U5L09_11400 [Bacteroidales bacterium]|nr:hypothetical protein [Bacteroidales bacterium]
MLRQEDNRVTIGSDSPEILMEYQTGPNVYLKPIDMDIIEEAPSDSHVNFNVENGKKAFTSWSLKIMDDKGKVQHFGPYTGDTKSIPGKAILKTLPEGNFKATMTGEKQKVVKPL